MIPNSLLRAEYYLHRGTPYLDRNSFVGSNQTTRTRTFPILILILARIYVFDSFKLPAVYILLLCSPFSKPFWVCLVSVTIVHICNSRPRCLQLFPSTFIYPYNRSSTTACTRFLSSRPLKFATLHSFFILSLLLHSSV